MIGEAVPVEAVMLSRLSVDDVLLAARLSALGNALGNVWIEASAPWAASLSTSEAGAKTAGARGSYSRPSNRAFPCEGGERQISSARASIAPALADSC
jgi:hypothetical protein